MRDTIEIKESELRNSNKEPIPVRHRFIVRDRLSLLSGNVLLALLWLAFNGAFTLKAGLGGFIFSAIILTAFNRQYIRWLWGVIAFLLLLAFNIVQSSLQVAGQILFGRVLEQSIIEYELTADSDIETMFLATAITLTPGTISVDARFGPNGKRYLYVHLLDGRNPGQFRNSLKYGIERRIYELARV